MSRDELLYLEDIQLCCQKVLRFTDGITFETFLSDEKTIDAVVRNLEIVGESAKHVSQEIRDRHPVVSWRNMAGFRDIVSQAYVSVNVHIVWDIVQTKIPALLEQVNLILEIESTSDDAPES